MESFPRARRIAVRPPASAGPRCASAPLINRERKGLLDFAKASWRRCTTGSNHISAFGVWRDRARRSMRRINRTGETRWHRLPSARQLALSEQGRS